MVITKVLKAETTCGTTGKKYDELEYRRFMQSCCCQLGKIYKPVETVIVIK